jgi:rhodanese-related sulfurtransferase
MNFSNQTISPRQASEARSSALFLDVRTPAEFEEMHIEGAVLHPLSDLNPSKVTELSQGKSGCVIICRSGGRAKQACEKLGASGVTGLSILEGGITAWEGAGLPVVRGQKTISLERQVRIAAGALVFIGAVLGYFVNPAWIALSAFVGAGLVFAGVTDTCGMAMMLAKMPWNTRVGKQGACCAPQTSCATKN